MALQNFGAKVRKFCLSYPFFNLFSSLGDVRRRFRSTAEQEHWHSPKFLLNASEQVSSPFVLSPLRSESVSFVAERGKIQIHLVFRSLIRNFATKVAKLLHFGIKKKQVSFVLHSIFRNFAAQNERYDEII